MFSLSIFIYLVTLKFKNPNLIHGKTLHQTLNVTSDSLEYRHIYGVNTNFSCLLN